MIHRSRFALLGLVFLLAAPVALADDIVHFANGTFMKVQGYTIEGDMVKVNLGPGAAMSFPRTLVASIERAGRTIYPQTPAGATANVVSGGSVGGQVVSSQYLQRGEDQLPARSRAAAGEASGEGTADDEDKEAAARRDPTEYQLPGGRGAVRALGRRAAPIGEALVEKGPNAPPPQVQRPRAFTALAPKGAAPATPPAPAPPEADETVPPPDDAPVEREE